MDSDHLFFTAPGLRQDLREPESQLIQKINKVKEKVDKVIVVFGGKFCYVNVDDPLRTMRKINV